MTADLPRIFAFFGFPARQTGDADAALVVAAAVVPQSAAKSLGTSAVGWRPPPSGRQHIASLADHLRTDLDQLLPQARQRPVFTAPACAGNCRRADCLAN